VDLASSHETTFTCFCYRPTQNVSQIMQLLKGMSSRMLKKFWGRHLRARGYLAVSSGNITDAMIKHQRARPTL